MLSVLIEKVRAEAKAEAARRGVVSGSGPCFGDVPSVGRDAAGEQMRIIWDGVTRQEPVYHPRTLKPIAKGSKGRYLSGDATTVLLTANQAAKERKRRGWD